MFTPMKILFLLVILAAVWFAFTRIERYQRRMAAGRKHEAADTVDLRQCASCGAWVSGACEKPQCVEKG